MIVMTVGTFDLMHRGHTNLFERCRELSGGSFLQVRIGVNSRRFVEEYKGITPHDTIQKRMYNVAPYGVPFLHDDNMKDDLIKWKPKLLVVGSDWARKDYHAQIKMTQDELDELDVSVVYVPMTPGISSTQLRAERA